MCSRYQGPEVAYLPWEGIFGNDEACATIGSNHRLGVNSPNGFRSASANEYGQICSQAWATTSTTRVPRWSAIPPPPPPVTRFVSSEEEAEGICTRPKPKPRKPDPSIEPIAADEPVPPAGFPVLPERLELPIAMGSWGGARRWRAAAVVPGTDRKVEAEAVAPTTVRREC